MFDNARDRDDEEEFIEPVLNVGPGLYRRSTASQ